MSELSAHFISEFEDIIKLSVAVNYVSVSTLSK